MTDETRPRRGLVLGGGGVLGGAWMVGALTALEAELGTDAREFDQIVGTSAGAFVGGLLAAGVPVSELLEHQVTGRSSEGLLAAYAWDHDTATGGSRPPLPRPRVGSRNLLRQHSGHLRELPPQTVLAALLPEGRGTMDEIHALVQHLVPSGWVERRGLSIVALDYDTGERTVFGRPGSPPVDLHDAVAASCSIPGWYQPVVLDGHRYVDGGMWSSTNVDVLAGLGLDEVYVIAPQLVFHPPPRRLTERMLHRWRRMVTARCLREVALVHSEGTEVTVLAPGEEDHEAMGPNMMDVGRRPHVVDVSLRTSVEALRDPEPFGELLAELGRGAGGASVPVSAEPALVVDGAPAPHSTTTDPNLKDVG